MNTLSDSRTLEPAVIVARPVSTWRIRIGGAGVAIAALAVLGVGAWLSPRPDGMGTHTELGLPPCGFLFSVGIPCPTCGMTTAYSLMTHGRVLGALRTQPAGAVLCLLTMAAAVMGIRVAMTGRMVRLNWDWLGTGPGLATMGAIFFGGWTWKIVDFLLTQRG